MKIKEINFLAGPKRINCLSIIFEKEIFFYFSDKNNNFTNLTLSMNGINKDEFLNREIITNKIINEEFFEILKTFQNYLAKKFEVPIFSSFDLELFSVEESFEFVKNAKKEIISHF